MKRISESGSIIPPSSSSSSSTFFSSKFRAHILLLISQFCWSLWHVIGSLTLSKGVNPIIFALYRELTASICMFLLVFIMLGPSMKNFYIEKEDILRFIFLGFCSFVNVVFAIVSLEYVTATTFSVMQPIIPCIATFISILVGLEQSSIMKIGGILLSVTGAVVVEAWKTKTTTNDDDDINDNEKKKDYIKGYIIILCQVTAMACLIVFQKSILSKYKPAMVSFTYYSIGAIFTCFVCLIWGYHYKKSEWLFNNLILPWEALIYASLIATVFTFTSISWSAKKLPPSITTVYWTWQPVGTALLSYVILNEIIHLNEIVGGLLVAIGLIITLTGRQHEIKIHRDYSSVAANDNPINTPMLTSQIDRNTLLPINSNDEYMRISVSEDF